MIDLQEEEIKRRPIHLKYLAACLSLVLLPIIPLLSQEVIIEEQDGVIIVRNPKKPVELPGESKTLKLREDLQIGIESGDENYMFSQLNSIQVSENGEIIAYDGREISFKIYDSSGKFLRKFGREGQGPGEIQRAAYIHLIGETIDVMDLGNNRFSYYSLEGKCIKEIPTGKYRPYDAKADSRGNVYGYVLIIEKPVTLNLLKFNQKFELIQTITSKEMPKAPPPPDLIELIRFHIFGDDNLIWGRTYEYEFDILDKNGRLIKRIIREYNPIRITKDNLIDEFKRRYPGKELPAKVPRIPAHFPKHFPVFENFICDEMGGIYVRTFERDENGNVIHDVFDPEGRFSARLALPFKEEVTVVKKSLIYCIVGSDKEGIPKIKRYVMTWE